VLLGVGWYAVERGFRAVMNARDRSCWPVSGSLHTQRSHRGGEDKIN